MRSKPGDESDTGRSLTTEEVRTVADLRIMHAKVDELFQIVSALKRSYSEADIHRYADAPRLAEDIQRVDEIYLWFVRLKERREREQERRHRG